MEASAPHYLTVSHAGQADLAAAHAFHQRRSGEYLWPRDYDEFATLVDDRHVFIAYEEKTIVGLCYVVDDGERREFGGLYVEENLRGRGIAAVLGRVAIASAYIWDYIADDPWDLIAHVHELNSAPGESPRSLLTRQLGFEDIQQKEVPPVDAPPNMRTCGVTTEGKSSETCSDFVARLWPNSLIGLRHSMARFEASR